MLRLITLILAMLSPAMAFAAGGFTFNSIDGGVIDLDEFRGKPVLVVNTASRCGFTKQYDGLQALHDTYADRGLVVLAVPSNDFKQELASESAVKEFCEVNFNLTLPMTEITRVKGDKAHPFYAWLEEAEGFTPSWNFNKVLLGPDGQVLGTFASPVQPDSRKITKLFMPYLSN